MATSSCRPREGKEAKRRRWRKKRAAFEEAPRLADAKRLRIGRCDGVCGLHSIVEQYIDELNALPSPRGVRIASRPSSRTVSSTSGCRPREGKEAKRRRWRKKRATFEEAPRLADAKRLGIGGCDGACGLHHPQRVPPATAQQVAVPVRGADCINCFLTSVTKADSLPSPRGVRIASSRRW